MDVTELSARLQGTATTAVQGRLRDVVGDTLTAHVPGARVGQLVRIERPAPAGPLLAEVCGLRDGAALLLPYGPADGLSATDAVVPLGRGLTVPTGRSLLGRIVDALGQPLDGGAPIAGPQRPVARSAPAPLSRRAPHGALSTGIRVIDGLLTLAEGQRIGLFAPAGVGKSTLLSQIARGTDADAFVLCLVGERGREVREMIESGLGHDLARGTVVVAGSDEPAMRRVRAAQTAVTLAEALRDDGARVLLLMDSLTRYARAQRDLGLSLGELPVRRGYPPSVLSALPQLVERCGCAAQGSITAVFSVLVEADDADEPLADELRGLLDGHLVLDRQLAARGHFPAVSVPDSLSRLMTRVVDTDHQRRAGQVRALLSHWAQHRELVSLGAYRSGADPRLDEAIAHIDAIEAFLRQPAETHVTATETRARLEAVTRPLHAS